MPTLATVTARIQQALAAKPDEMASWVTTEEAKGIVDEARAANDPAADQAVGELVEKGMAADPSVYHHDGASWGFHPNTWATSHVDRVTRVPPPPGKVFMDDPGADRFHDHNATQFNTSTAMGVFNTYLVEKNSTSTSRFVGSLRYDKDRANIENKTFTLKPGSSLSFDLTDSNWQGKHGSISITPKDVLTTASGAKTGYTPGDRLPIRRTSITVPATATPGTEFNVQVAGLKFKIVVG